MDYTIKKKNDITTLTDIIKVYFTFQAKKIILFDRSTKKKPWIDHNQHSLLSIRYSSFQIPCSQPQKSRQDWIDSWTSEAGGHLHRTIICYTVFIA